jgi:anti-sigma factor RsiW
MDAMGETRHTDPCLPDHEAAELAAFLDGRLSAERHAAVAARVAADAVLAAALDRRRAVAAAIGAAICDIEPPLGLRRRLRAI